MQLAEGRHFLREQPFPTLLDEEPPWPQVLQHPNVSKEVIDQCRFGMQIDGSMVKKPTEVLAASPVLLRHFKGKRCTGDHEHALLDGVRSAKAKLWT